MFIPRAFRERVLPLETLGRWHMKKTYQELS